MDLFQAALDKAAQDPAHAAMLKDESLLRVANFANFNRASEVSAQAKSAFLRPNPTLDAALSNSAAAGLPPISVNSLSGQFLSILTRTMGAKNVLEVGTLGGYSSICFAQAGAKVTSIEIDPKHRDVAMKNVEGLDVEVLLGSHQEVMPRLIAEGRKFDLVFIDADMVDMWEQFDHAVRLTRPNGCVFMDDVVASMFRYDDVGKEDNVLAKVGNDERVQATLVPVALSHPLLPTPVFNGFIFATVKGE